MRLSTRDRIFYALKIAGTPTKTKAILLRNDFHVFSLSDTIALLRVMIHQIFQRHRVLIRFF